MNTAEVPPTKIMSIGTGSLATFIEPRGTSTLCSLRKGHGGEGRILHRQGTTPLIPFKFDCQSHLAFCWASIFRFGLTRGAMGNISNLSLNDPPHMGDRPACMEKERLGLNICMHFEARTLAGQKG